MSKMEEVLLAGKDVLERIGYAGDCVSLGDLRKRYLQLFFFFLLYNLICSFLIILRGILINLNGTIFILVVEQFLFPEFLLDL